MTKSLETKFETVIRKNTFFFFNTQFEEKYEGYLNSIREILLVLKAQIEIDGLKKEHFERLLADKENGLIALLALTGFSNEYLKRLITLARVVDDHELSKLILKQEWCKIENHEQITEWSDAKIQALIRDSNSFRKGIVNLFFEGATIPLLANTLPLFELKKLSISKLQFEVSAMIDTLVRYKEKGSYTGKTENNPETLLKSIFNDLAISFEKGDLQELIENTPNLKRSMDFIVPTKINPQIIIECSFVATTSSAQGDKAKTELSVRQLLKQYYPQAKFIGFVDGIGWYVRPNDLKRMVAAYDDVFTFHPDELNRFRQFVIKEVSHA